MHEVTAIKNPSMETRSGWHYSLSQTLIIEAIHLGNLLNPQKPYISIQGSVSVQDWKMQCCFLIWTMEAFLLHPWH
jgi:hypothetical protein